MKSKALGKQLLACSCGLLLIVAACKKSTTVSPQEELTTTAPRALTYQLVWADEFDGSSVNTANWNFETGGGGWGNNEQQYYQSSNASVANGNLVITARKQTVGSNQYTSARMQTAGKRQFTYGRIEARMKLPMGQGLWPAFWMLGANIGSVGWPASGEIDIMEHVNTSTSVLGTIHWNGPNGYSQYGGNTTTSPGDYHTYRIDWNSSSIAWFVDGVQFHTANIANNINSTEEFHKPFFILLNMAVGGNLPGQTIDQGKLPASMYVDYVRVYNAVETSGSAPIGQVISLRGNNNLLVCGQNGTQPMRCDKTAAGDWERYTVIDAGGGKIALRSMGKYVSSENGAQAITCNRTSIGDWEKFDWVVNADGKISLRGNNGRYISSENGTADMTCNRTSISGWEAFSYF
ncbi:family 16 glycosylhydrolase [Hufsiella ginkgonis]|uniref:Family 16 glycosylhydrolase n=1 Tax=Hufsiella ginkgonis TaxID=2695274 RepID=A0A7K1XVG4_9SPHI|nr:family 16 glycosylhydrolase [Hufsiella ginkgonis]MXV14797.1 family 16 glycosylhydrolase [Hufsiella ginkgonis]